MHDKRSGPLCMDTRKVAPPYHPVLKNMNNSDESSLSGSMDNGWTPIQVNKQVAFTPHSQGRRLPEWGSNSSLTSAYLNTTTDYMSTGNLTAGTATPNSEYEAAVPMYQMTPYNAFQQLQFVPGSYQAIPQYSEEQMRQFEADLQRRLYISSPQQQGMTAPQKDTPSRSEQQCWSRATGRTQ